nr:MAG TPA: hypothetical protein [Caudoviricetes sp.]
MLLSVTSHYITYHALTSYFNDLRHFIHLPYIFITELYKHARNLKYRL